MRRGQAAPSLREQRHAFAADPAPHADGQRYVLRLRPDLCGRLADILARVPVALLRRAPLTPTA